MKSRFQPLFTQCKPLAENLNRQIQAYFQKAQAFWQPYQEKLKARWQNLESREKNTILGGTILVSILLLYILIWSPFHDHLDDLRQKIHHEKKTAIWMDAASRQLKSLEAKQEAPSGKLLSRRLNAVQEALSQAPHSKNMSQLAQTNPEEIHCVFDQVDFDSFMIWLIGFAQEQDLIIKQASIQRLNNVGLVKAELIFKIS